MSLVSFSAQNHPQQIPSDEVDDRALPQVDFDVLNRRFDFTVDAAAAAHNAKLPRYWTRADNGLIQPWAGERVYCNPPFSDIAPWVGKAWAEQWAELIVILLPANRTEQTWWQERIEPYRDRMASPLRVEFQRGRWRFIASGERAVKPNNRPPFGCCLCIWSYNTVPSFD